MKQVEDILCQSFPKLVSISFDSQSDLKNNVIEEFLALNSQLKKIGIVLCPNINGSLFQSIATHVPDIEIIQIGSDGPISNNDLKYIGKLKYLHTLKLFMVFPKLDHSYVLSILYEIYTAKIPLLHLPYM